MAAYVEASGQLAEFSQSGPFGFKVTNATCAHYYLYVSVVGTVAPTLPPTPVVDAGDDGSDDASGDAPSDALGEGGQTDAGDGGAVLDGSDAGD